MFIREKRNKSGSISVQVLQKIKGHNKLLKSIGSSKDEEQLVLLRRLAQEFIDDKLGQLKFDLPSEESSDSEWFDVVHRSIKSVKLVGPELILGKLYDDIGFNQIIDPLFRHLVISRIIYPSSKLKTVRYLMEYEMKEYQVDKLYRYMDKLEAGLKTRIEQISFNHTKKILDGLMSVVFYDVTTIYFEAEREDDLRISGFSKEGKHKHPQILLGLLVSVDGYPLAYEIFKGNEYEGHTMLPVINKFKTRFNIDQLVVIADSGLLSKDNIEYLISTKQEFILGARIKSERDDIKRQITSLQLKDNECHIIKKSEELKLVINYTKKRAKKDEYNRKRGMTRLEKNLTKGRLTKSNLNNRGYNKYLRLTGKVDISIDYDKFERDAQWDGLKGYLTNTKLSAKELLANYNELWKIEKAFRISKTDLRIRPVYHRLERRIKAHICISFAAYKLYKELERQISLIKSPFSAQRVIELMKTIYGIEIEHPATAKSKLITHTNKPEQRKLLKIFKIDVG